MQSCYSCAPPKVASIRRHLSETHCQPIHSTTLISHLACLFLQRHLAKTYVHNCHNILYACLRRVTLRKRMVKPSSIVHSTTAIASCMLVCAVSPCGSILSSYTASHSPLPRQHHLACLFVQRHFGETYCQAIQYHTVHFCNNILHACLCSIKLRKRIVKPYNPLL